MAGVKVPQGLKLITSGTFEQSKKDAPERPEAKDVPTGLTPVKRPDLMSHAEGTGWTDDERKDFAKTLPQTAGGIVGGIVGATGGPVGSVFGAALGGATGEAALQLYEHWTGDPDAPKSSREAYQDISISGAEEGAMDATGQVLGKIVGKGYHLLRPKRGGGVDELQRMIRERGGSFTTAQRTPAWSYQQLDSLVRGSLTGKGPMLAADAANDKAMKKWANDMSDYIAATAKKNMTGEEFTEFLRLNLVDGQAAFRAHIGRAYSGFDDLVKSKMVVEMNEVPIAPSILDQHGKPFLDTTIETTLKEVRPVDARPLKQAAQEFRERFEKIGNVGKTDFGGQTIDGLTRLDDALDFSSAHTLYSTLGDVARMAKDAGDNKLYGSAVKFKAMVSKQMEAAAKAQGGDAHKLFMAIRKEAADGYEAFNSNLMYQLTKDNLGSSRIADILFKDGDVSAYRQFDQALKKAAQYSDEVDVTAVKNQVKQKYLENILRRSTREVELNPSIPVDEMKAASGLPDTRQMAMFFQDPKKREVLDVMFSAKEQDAMYKFVNALGLTETKSQAGLGMLMQLAQGGVFINALAGKEGAAKQAVGFFLPLSFFSWAMTNPVAIRVATSAATTSLAAKQAPNIALKLSSLYDEYQSTETGKKPFKQRAIEYTQEIGASANKSTSELLNQMGM